MSSDSLAKLLTAGGTILVVLLLVFAVDRAFKARGRKLSAAYQDPTLQTRLRFVKRLVEAAIVVIGIATALNQFTALDRFAASVLASGAIAAAVIGFAAQQTLSNVIAGVMLAVTQPIRIGDQVAFDDFSGVVEDIRLSHTFLQTGSDTRIIVPNGRLASAVVRNDSIVTETVGVQIEVWLAGESDELRAIDVIEAAIPETSATIKQVNADGTVLAVAGTPAASTEHAGRQAQLFRETLQALRRAGLR
ncbi:MAG TPA: mechanosensitive ion channel domain-containing protein [Casimicrobiaceae bacterium]